MVTGARIPAKVLGGLCLDLFRRLAWKQILHTQRGGDRSLPPDCWAWAVRRQ